MTEMFYRNHKQGRQEARATAVALGHTVSPFVVAVVGPGRVFEAVCGRCDASMRDNWNTKSIVGTALDLRCH